MRYSNSSQSQSQSVIHRIQYQWSNQDKFTSIFVRYHDQAPSKICKPQSRASITEKLKNKQIIREQILFQRYLLIKKGKKFNQIEKRMIKIDDGRLYQVDAHGSEKSLPFPIKIKQEHREQAVWQIPAQYKFRLALEFDERSPVEIYFEQLTNCQQIHAFLACKSKPDYKYTLLNIGQAYKNKIAEQFRKCLREAKASQTLVLVRKNREEMKLRAIEILRTQYTNQNMIRNMIFQWNKMTRSTHQARAKVPELEKVQGFSIEIASVQFIELSDSNHHQNLYEGKIKLWVGSSTYPDTIPLDPSSSITQQKVRKYIINHTHHSINVTGDLSIETYIQFQMDLIQIDSQGRNIEESKWRSQRFIIKDWLFRECQLGSGFKILMMYSKGRIAFLKVRISDITSLFSLSEKNPPYDNPRLSITPVDYPIINQMIPQQFIERFKFKAPNTGLNLPDSITETISLQSYYKQLTQQYLNKQRPSVISTRVYKQLYNLLDIPSLINKFYQNYPFSQYINVTNPATFVYQYLVEAHNTDDSIKLSSRQKNLSNATNFKQSKKKLYYHDVEKFIWQFQHFNIRRFLSALKAFDQTPRINFTEPFYWLCIRCIEIANADASQEFDSDNNFKYEQQFDNSIIGRQSMAFFLVLALLKQGSSLLLYQAEKKALSKSTLLFHYILKTQYQPIYQKILETQMNIEAFFGMQMAGLLSSLVPADLFAMILQKLIREKQEDPKQTYQKTLVSAFLAIIILTHKLYGSGVLYMSAQHYLRFIQRFCGQNFISSYIAKFIILLEQNYRICQQYIEKSQFNEISQSMDQFYKQSQSTVEDELQHNTSTSICELTLGEILEKLYNSFSCYKHKNEGDIRKISMVFDKVILGKLQPYTIQDTLEVKPHNSIPGMKSLVLSIYQNKNKLYYHQFVNISNYEIKQDERFGYEGLNHNLEIKLVRLEKLEIIIYQKQNNCSNPYGLYKCFIDPKQLPSNYYLQEKLYLSYSIKNSGHHDPIQQKLQSLQNSMDFYRGGSVDVQIYIKDSCEIQYIDNMVPDKYMPLFLLNQSNQSEEAQLERIKNEVLFCNNYFRVYRMPQNNFNLLYSKLGWYGNHYLIPDDRLLSIRKVKVSKQLIQNINRNSEFISKIGCVPEVAVQELPQEQASILYKILFYTRCLYGRGLIPKINLTNPISSESEAFLSTKSCYKLKTDQGLGIKNIGTNEKHELNYRNADQVWYNSCSKTMHYLLNNFNASTSNFVAYYIKMVQELPLIRYLGFRTRQFYILNDINMTLELRVPIDTSNDKSLINNNYKNSKQGYTQIHGNRISNFVKNKILSSSKPIIPAHNISQQEGLYIYSKPIKIQFCNNPLRQNSKQNEIWRFRPGHSFSDEQVQDLCQAFNWCLEKQLISDKMIIPQQLFFSYCEYRITLDEFLYWLKLNIAKYYLLSHFNTHKSKSNKQQSPTKHNKKESRESTLWNYSIQPKDKTIPNIKLHSFYQFILETQYNFVLQTEYHPTLKSHHSKPVTQRYQDWAFLNNTWTKVQVIVILSSAKYCLVYIQQQYTQSKYIIEISNVILDANRLTTAKPHPQQNKVYGIKVLQFTDKQLKGLEHCVRSQLILHHIQ